MPIRVRVALALAGVALVFAFEGCSHAPRPGTATAEESTPAKHPAPTRPRRAAREPAAGVGAGAVAAGSSTSPRAVPDSTMAPSVVPQLSSTEAKALEKSSREQIDAVLLKLGALDGSRLDSEQQRKLQIAQGFVADAIAARMQQDWMRASQLATKARVLAEELNPR
ncbi:MAG: hypothetical protein ABI960_03455 [Candidatus Eisenbacteria bacterium]